MHRHKPRQVKMIDLSVVCLTIVFLLECRGTTGLQSPPPTMIVHPRQWKVSPEDPVGAPIAQLTVNTQDDVTPVTFSMSSLTSGDDIDQYFRIDKNKWVHLAKPITEKQVGSRLMRVSVQQGGRESHVELQVIIQNADGGGRFLGGPSIQSNLPPIPNYPPPPNPFNPPPLPTNLSPHPGLAYQPQQEPAPLLRLSKYWHVGSGAGAGSVVAYIDVVDLARRGYNVTIGGDLEDWLRVPLSGGNVTLTRPLPVGQHSATVVASSPVGNSREDVVLYVQDPIQPPAPKGTTTKTSQDLLVLGGSSTPLPDTTTPEPPQEASSEGGVTLTVIPIVVVVGACPILMAAVCYWWRRRKRKATAESKETAVVYSEKGLEANGAPMGFGGEEEEEEENGEMGLGRGLAALWRRRAESNKYVDNSPNNGKKSGKRKASEAKANPPDDWEFPRHKLWFLERIGEGSFGQVWKCEALGLGVPGRRVTAIKMARSPVDRDRLDLCQELKVLKSMGSHINVVSLLGCCTDQEPMYVILEFMCGGKLQSYLRSSRADTPYDNLHGSSSSLTARDLIHFAYQISRGMEFLTRNGVIHRDLAARNILVGEDKVVKVADFGFARDVANNCVYERKSDGKLPIRWMAPESLFDNIFTTKSDVWSFGVLLWEIVTLGSTPYPGMGAAEVMKKVRTGYRLEKPEHCRREIYNIMYYCWDKDVKERPSFSELVNTLEGLLMSEVEYIELNQFPDHNYYNIQPSEKSDEKV